jgi:hypothetical protein
MTNGVRGHDDTDGPMQAPGPYRNRLFRFKLALLRATDRTDPIIGKVFKRRPGLYTVFRVSFLGIIDIPTD